MTDGLSTLEVLERLIAFDTVSHNSNLDLIAFVEDSLRQKGFRVTRLPSPCGLKAGLYAEIGPEVEGGLLLSAHSDVVPVTGQDWTRPPFQLVREGDKLFGRGTTDMKGFLAAALSVAAEAEIAQLKRPVGIILSYDEEIGCVGLQEIASQLPPLLKAPSLCIVGEPTEMQVATGHKGKTAYKATFHGEAGHSALAPNFPNALHFAADFIQKLRQLQSDIAGDGPFDLDYDIPYTTIHVGKLSGGTALNIVPASAEMHFETRNLATQDQAGLHERIMALGADLAPTGTRVPVDIEVTNTYPGLEVDAAQTWVGNVIEVSHQKPTKVAFGTEAGILSDLGVPTLVCGPGSMAGQGHKADEFIQLDQLTSCERFLTQLVRRLTA